MIKNRLLTSINVCPVVLMWQECLNEPSRRIWFPGPDSLVFKAPREAATASFCAAVSVFVAVVFRLVQQHQQPARSDPQQAGRAPDGLSDRPVSGWWVVAAAALNPVSQCALLWFWSGVNDLCFLCVRVLKLLFPPMWLKVGLENVEQEVSRNRSEDNSTF